MEDESEKLKSYLDRIDRLQEAQKAISDEMLEIKKEIRAEWYNKTIAKNSTQDPLIEEFVPITYKSTSQSSPSHIEEVTSQSIAEESNNTLNAEVKPEEKSFYESYLDKINSKRAAINWEKFVGENLISKLGVLIILIGVVIGAKYSIENDLINPTTRIAIGYLFGFVMLCVGIWSKAKYINYSAVLVSGAMAIMFFITFFAYSFYELIALEVAFGMMVLFTVFTVLAAMVYNRQVIAIIGLIGAYAVPFLLSNDSGAYLIFFSYITMVNIGILFIAFKRDWKYLFYITFTLTWAIYLSWFQNSASEPSNFQISFTFLGIFFTLFYALVLAYKIFNAHQVIRGDIIFILVNALIFFFAGYLLLGYNSYDSWQGLFTLGNGVIHFLVATFVFKKEGSRGVLFYLLAALVLLFITITIPIQLGGNAVPILWVMEAAILFWIGRTKKVKILEYFSYPIMLSAMLSVVDSWNTGYLSNGLRYSFAEGIETMQMHPIMNTYFLTSIIAVIGFSWMWKVNKEYYDHKTEILSIHVSRLLNIVLSCITGLVLFMAFKNEIALYWDIEHNSVRNLMMGSDYSNELYVYSMDMLRFKTVWLQIYSMLFFVGVSWLTMLKVRNQLVGRINIAANFFLILSFLIAGLYALSVLRNNYLDPNVFLDGHMAIIVRYVALLSAAALMYSTYKYKEKAFVNFKWKRLFSLFFNICLLWVVTSEFIHWADIFGLNENYKLSLSILWGLYSVVLVSYGIWQNRKHLRIMAIALFGITLVKLFVYDIAHLNTISKTIVFVSLGVLLLIISFLYNKYTGRINDEV